MTATVEAPTTNAPTRLYPVRRNAIRAVTICARCSQPGCVEWLPDGGCRVLHKGHMCVMQFAESAPISPEMRALLLLW